MNYLKLIILFLCLSSLSLASQATTDDWNDYPQALQGPIETLDFSLVPTLDDSIDLAAVFSQVRDKRILTDNAHPSFLRRISWLYPDSGCDSRAAMAADYFEQLELPRPAKIFVFGELAAQTDFTASGTVDWAWHVAPLVQWQDQYYVIDPTTVGTQILTLEDWLAAININNKKIQGVVCNAHSYSYMGRCLAAGPGNEADAQISQVDSLLTKEWQRVQSLGYQPEQVLGELPPWF